MSLSWLPEKDNKVTYTLTYDKRGFIALKYSGFISPPEAQESSVKAIEMAVKHAVKLYLADHSESVVVLPIEQVNNLMDKLADLTEVSRNAKLATVLPAAGGQARKDLESFITIAANQGWIVAAFNTRQEAIDWLLDLTDGEASP